MDVELTRRYINELTALGLTVPEQALIARDIYENAAAAANDHPVDRLRAEYEAGELTPENVAGKVLGAARDLNARTAAFEVVRDMHITLTKGMKGALREASASLTAEFIAMFEPRAEQMMAAAQRFGPGTTAAEVITMGPAAVKSWQQVDGCSAVLTQISGAYVTLVRDVMHELPESPVTLFITGGVDLDQARQLYSGAGRWLSLAAAGATLRLNTMTEAAAVVARARDAEAAAAAVEKEAQRAAHRARHMPMQVPAGRL